MASKAEKTAAGGSSKAESAEGDAAGASTSTSSREFATFVWLSGQVVFFHAVSAACTERVFTDKAFHSPIFFQLVESTFNFVVQLATRFVRFTAAARALRLSATAGKRNNDEIDDADVEGDAMSALGHANNGARARKTSVASAKFSGRRMADEHLKPVRGFWASIVAGFTWGHFFVGLGTVVSHGLSYIGYHELNYTTATLLKSGKVVSVMLLGFMVNGRKFSWRAVSLATILCVGLGIFGLADKASEVPRFSVKGLVACLLSLVGSAVCANLQDMLLKRDRMAAAPHPAPIAPPSSVTASVPPVASSPPISSVKEDLMLYQNFVATALAILYCAITGDLAKGTQFLMYGPRRAVLATFGSVSFVYVGMFPLLQIVQQFDATQAQVVTSLRKAVTFVASFVIYPKPFTGMHMTGLLFSLAGSYLLEKELMRGKHKPPPPTSSSSSSSSVASAKDVLPTTKA